MSSASKLSLRWYERNFVLVFGGLTIVVILVVCYFLIVFLEKKTKEIVSFQLDANFNTTVDRLLEWHERSVGKINVIATNPSDNKLFINLIHGVGDQQAIRENIDANIQRVLVPLGFDGYSVFNTDRQLLAATSKEYIGVVASSPTIIKVLDKALHGEYGISHPVVAVRKIEGPRGEQPVGTLFQMLCTTIKNPDNSSTMEGYLCFRFNPQTTLFPIFRTGLVGYTGEAYAIASDGTLITPSRFGSSKNIQITDNDYSYAVATVEARVPIDGIDNQQGPLTELANKVVQKKQKNTLFNYPDYRGINVVGTGEWLEKMDFGIIVEQDWDEAFQTFLIARQVIFGLSVITIILIVLLCIGFSYNRHLIFLRERRFRSLLKNLPTPVYIKNSQGRFITVNPEFERFVNLVRDDLVGASTRELPISAWLLPIFENDIFPYTREENASGKLIELVNTRGQLKYYRVLRFHIGTETQENVTSIATILTDVTERILASAQLAEINQRLEELVEVRTQELLEAKDRAEMASRAKAEFLANMSHEIRTPLNTILGLAHVALNAEISDQVRVFLEKMRASGKHLLNIINDILNFSRLEVGKLELDKRGFSINEVIDSTVNLIKEKTRSKGLQLNVRTDLSIPSTLFGDPLRLSQILINFCANAVKFTDVGSISLVTNNTEIENNRVHLEFRVEDTGIGISDKLIGTLFTPFHQVDSSSSRKFEGSGLGLAICKNLADLMGADIYVISEPGKGTIFTLKLSLEYSHEILADNQINTDENFSLSKLVPLNCQILLVEDNHLNSEVTQSLLTLMGATVDVAFSGKEALDKLESLHFDIVLMDIQMPDMDGIETTRRIRQMALNKLPIIAVTANALHGDREWFLNNGFDDYLSKPIEPLVLRSLIIRNLHMEFHKQKVVGTIEPGNIGQHLVSRGNSEKDIFAALTQADIDTEKALGHLMNNADLYVSALEKFSSQRLNFIDELSEFIQQNKIDLARNHVHSLASLSSMLGLSKVAELAKQLEISFLDGNVDRNAVSQLALELRGVITLIRAWLHMREFNRENRSDNKRSM